MIKHLVIPQAPTHSHSPSKGGESRERVRVAGVNWTRERVGNGWERVKIPHKPRERVGNGSPPICACLLGNGWGTGQILTAKRTPQKTAAHE